MAEIITIPDLENGKVDIDTLADIVNLQEPTTETRLSGPVNTWFGVQSSLSSATGRAFSTKSAMDAVPGTVVGQAARVTADSISTNNGMYIWSGSAWVKTTDPLGYDSLSLNSGKDYPMARKVRGGINLTGRPEFLAAVLDMKVWGADPLYYYRLSVMGNGSSTLGGQGFTFEKVLKSTFESSGAPIIIHSRDSAVKFNLDYTAKGKQYQRIVMDAEPNVTVEFWFDVDKLPPFGTGIAASNTTALGYNWITDPVAYRTEEYPLAESMSDLDSLTINRGKDYPMVPYQWNTAGPVNVHPFLVSSLLSAEVIGAREGYSYRIPFIQNGVTIGELTSKYGVTITRIPNDQPNTEQNILTYLESTVQLVPDRVKGGIQTFLLPCVLDPQTTVKLVFDVDAMPPDGTAIQSTGNSNNGYNSRIIPALYDYGVSGGGSTDLYAFKEGECLAEWTAATSELTFTRKSKTKWYQTKIARKSVNNTFTPLGFALGEAYTGAGELIPVEQVTFTRDIDGLSDYHSPLNFEVVNNPDVVVKGTGATAGAAVLVFQGGSQVASGTVNPVGGWQVRVNDFAAIGDTLQVQVGAAAQADYTVTTPTLQYTSGSHGSDSLDGGEPTAIQKEIVILFDGVEIDLSIDHKAKVSNVVCIGTIGAMASNTLRGGRIALDQNYVYELTDYGALLVSVNYEALEPLNLIGDNGLQAYMAGFTPIDQNNYYMFWSGITTARTKMPNGVFSSGPKSAYPNCLGVSITHILSGEFNTWIDLNYGIGDRQHLDPTQPLFEHSNIGGSKVYGRLISNPSGVPMTTGDKYQWRGGYSWGMPSATTTYDSIQKIKGGVVLAKHDGKHLVVDN